MEPTVEQVRQWEQGNVHFPDQLVPVAPEHWPESPSNTGGIVVAAFRSKSFVVVAWEEPSGFTRLSVNRTDWDAQAGRFRDNIGWDDLQRLKSEAGYGDTPAVELYPPDENVINTANVRHLFLLPSLPPFMWLRKGDEYQPVKLSEAA